VLVFQSIDGLFQLIPGSAPGPPNASAVASGGDSDEGGSWVGLAVDGLQMLLWFGVLQVVLGKLILGTSGATASASSRERTELNVRCFGLLLAHISAFAAKNLFSGVQQLAIFSQAAYTAVLTVPLAAVALSALFWLTNEVRWRYSAADGKVDEEEEEWDEETEESENDVVRPALSHGAIILPSSARPSHLTAPPASFGRWASPSPSSRARPCASGSAARCRTSRASPTPRPPRRTSHCSPSPRCLPAPAR
jgi:hypothetical protein